MKPTQTNATSPEEIKREDEKQQAIRREGREQAAFEAARARCRAVLRRAQQMLGSVGERRTQG
jgi:hypothetical protein